jgi:hypothetical protein
MTQGRGRRIETALPDATKVRETKTEREIREFGHPIPSPGHPHIDKYDPDKEGMYADLFEHAARVEETKKKRRMSDASLKRAGLRRKP